MNTGVFYTNKSGELAESQGEIVLPPPGQLVLPPDMLYQYTGGMNQSDQIALLPERVSWDKDAGFWSTESLGDGLTTIAGRLVAAVSIWAIWTDRVGHPECIDVGQACSALPHEMGLRIIFDDEVTGLFYWDAFGTAFRAAQGAVRRSKARNGYFMFCDRKQISTRFGPLYVPALERLNEGE